MYDFTFHDFSEKISNVYTLDLNAVELFNNALKSDIHHQKAIGSDELIYFVNQYMETKGNNEEFVKNFFESKTMQYTKVA